MPTPLPRSKVKKHQTWNAESVFASPEQFDAEVQNIRASLPAVKQYQGRRGENVDTFLAALDAIDKLDQRAAKVRVNATMASAVDANDQAVAGMNDTASSALAQVGAAVSFVEPELLSVGEMRLRCWKSM